MEMYYGSKGVNNYIEICVNEKDFYASDNYYVIRMLEDNDIGEIIKPIISKLDNNIFLRYPVNSLFVLDKFFIKSRPDIVMIEEILKTICESVKCSEQFLLNIDELVLLPEYMLWDDKSKKIKIIYAPFYNKKIQSQLKNFIEYIMRIFDYKNADSVMKLHHIYEIIMREDFDINELEKTVSYTSYEKKEKLVLAENYNNLLSNNPLTEIPSTEISSMEIPSTEIKDAVIVNDDSRYEHIIGINAAVSGLLFLAFLFINKEKVLFLMFLISIVVLVINSFVYILKKEKEDEIDIDRSMIEFEEKKNEYISRYNENNNYEETVNKISEFENDNVHNNVNKEAVDNKYKRDFKLIPLNDGLLEPIVINKDKSEIVIGRGKNEADYRLNKEQISRVHASIIIKTDGIYLKDHNSTNGTYINSARIGAYEEKIINLGDIIKLANEEFFVG
ncbi:MAG: FHA domain-containing protein [Lachnospiraceae bacterium]|nr:FHA domain-containing protein [Lachnospiraceae bacterium]